MLQRGGRQARRRAGKLLPKRRHRRRRRAPSRQPRRRLRRPSLTCDRREDEVGVLHPGQNDAASAAKHSLHGCLVCTVAHTINDHCVRQQARRVPVGVEWSKGEGQSGPEARGRWGGAAAGRVGWARQGQAARRRGGLRPLCAPGDEAKPVCRGGEAGQGELGSIRISRRRGRCCAAAAQTPPRPSASRKQHGDAADPAHDSKEEREVQHAGAAAAGAGARGRAS